LRGDLVWSIDHFKSLERYVLSRLSWVFGKCWDGFRLCGATSIAILSFDIRCAHLLGEFPSAFAISRILRSLIDRPVVKVICRVP